MAEMIGQASHSHRGEVTPPGTDTLPLAGEPIARRSHLSLERLLAAIERHQIEELNAIEAYGELAYRATDPVIRSLMRMLLQDEEHHHRALNAMAMELGALTQSDGRGLHIGPRHVGPATLEQVRELAAQEATGVRELRGLASETRSAPLGELLSLILGLIALDGEKHGLILRYVVKELEAASDAQSR